MQSKKHQVHEDMEKDGNELSYQSIMRERSMVYQGDDDDVRSSHIHVV